jgi:hypothetical protein
MALLLLFFLCPVFRAKSADPVIPLSYQSTMIGIGKTDVYDTYLSPLKYSGTSWGLFHEKIKMTRLMNGNVSIQHLINLEFAKTKNPTATANNYEGYLEYGCGLYYRLKPVNQLRFFAGLQADGLFGIIYNTRNGNNPVSGKINVNLNASGMAVYQFRIKQQPFLLRYQLDIPTVGIMFSPEFGQSYYNISVGDNENLIHFAFLHNQWIARNCFSIELPFNNFTLRLAYMNRIYETKMNSLDTHILSNLFYIGFSGNFFSISSRKINKNQYQSVFE